jgi:hypothetical protein
MKSGLALFGLAASSGVNLREKTIILIKAAFILGERCPCQNGKYRQANFNNANSIWKRDALDNASLARESINSMSLKND